MPGPGTYNFANMSIGLDAKKFTLKSRVRNMLGMLQILSNLLEPEELARKGSTPGPGQYPSLGIDAVGKYPISTVP